MEIDIRGKVKHTYLPLTKALLPLFEAIVNSIHAIEQAKISDGYIDIYIEREPGLLASEFWSIKNFVIVDNGIGFTEENFQSFKRPYTTYKESKGSKGIGRFLWLKAFKSASIESLYKENNISFSRKFDFVISDSGIENLLIEEASSHEQKTTVKLLDFNDNYRKKCPQKSATIAKRILEHCLVYFLTDKAPKIRLFDLDETISLNFLFEENVKPNSETKKFEIKSNKFSITNLRLLYSGDDSEHEIHFCAHNREVLSERLNKDIPDLHKKVRDENGKTFTYVAYISSKYLDDHVNSERTDFNLLKEASLEFEDEITLEELRNEAVDLAKQYLSPFLREIRERKNEEIETFVRTKAPQYRPLLKHCHESLNEIAPGLTDEKLDIELYKLSSKASIDLKERSSEILKSPVDDFRNYPEYTKTYNEFIEKFNDFGKSSLAQYIVHRKAILELFSSNLKKDENGKFKLEKDIHEIIFPLRRTSDDVDFERQNLWIIDEKLSYHKYLASDIQLGQLEPVSANGSDRPDLIVFNHPFAFVEGESPYTSIVIIEFKRPMRDLYSESENPISQVYGYIKKIQEGSATDKDGRVIPAGRSMPFYAYIICDITPKVKEFAENYGLTITPDQRGYFGYNPNFNTYVEVISFEKLISDAKQRNRILFDKLHLPIHH
ncbi:ATP-binding protein [Kovacikia minuta CCNUW1]|uniref:ATP-binding protein n=1 Tax=Kovacikia minuta TaxID=2931930 RepID=UPI001CCA9055|nr:ATP-binding protein [Kovacikia minuta]UBF28693.1 ATP-binding protein [Kovacikia minuta CCNUW1]